MRSLVIGVLAIALVCGVAWVLEPKGPRAQQDPAGPAVVRHTEKSPRHKSASHKIEARMARVPGQSQPVAQESAAPAPGMSRPQPVEPQTEASQTEPTVAQAEAVTPTTPQTPQDTLVADETIQNALAQPALAYVGSDPDSEMSWDEAINDPNLSIQGVQGMMEDMNEDGLSDQEDPATNSQP
jgi:hypothetical protein